MVLLSALGLALRWALAMVQAMAMLWGQVMGSWKELQWGFPVSVMVREWVAKMDWIWGQGWVVLMAAESVNQRGM